MSKIQFRYWESLLFLITVVVCFFSIYLQYNQHLEPCPLCLMQRFSAFLFGTCCMISLRLKTPKWSRRVMMAQMTFALMGIYFATRQLWLQSLPPDQSPACLPTLDIMIHYLPWRTVLETLLWGTSSCAEITWLWLGLSIAAWSLIYFVVIFLLSMIILCGLHRTRYEF